MFLPKANKYFDLFEAHAEKVARVAMLMREAETFKNFESIMPETITLEHEADRIVKEVKDLLENVLDPPLESRSDISKLMDNMDDVLDFLKKANKRIVLYHIDLAHPEITQFLDYIAKATIEIKTAVGCLRNLKSKENRSRLRNCCHAIKTIEHESDGLDEITIRKIVEDVPDSIIALRQQWFFKEVASLFEDSVNACEDVADFLEALEKNN